MCDHLYFERWPNYGIADDDASCQYLVQLVKEAARGGNRRRGHTPLFVIAVGVLVDLGPLSEQQVLAIESSSLESWSTSSIASIISEMRALRHPWMVEGLERLYYAHLVASSITKIREKVIMRIRVDYNIIMFFQNHASK